MGKRLWKGKSFTRIRVTSKGHSWEWNRRFLNLNTLFSITSFPTKKEVNLKAYLCNSESEKQGESKHHKSCFQCLIFRFLLCSR